MKQLRISPEIIEKASDEELDELIAIVESINGDAPVWYPGGDPAEVPADQINHKQIEAFHSEADELLLGGAAGGGKSDLLCGMAALGIFPNTLIYRKESTQAAGLIRRIKDLLPDVRYNGTEKTWTRDNGDIIQIGSIPHEAAKEKRQGQAFDLVCFDEVTHFSKDVYRYVSMWCRPSKPGQKTRIIATCNPPTSTEGLWVIQHWAAWLDPFHPNRAKSGEIRYYVTDSKGRELEVDGPEEVEIDGVLVKPVSRSFIQSLVSDNFYLATDRRYMSYLHSLDPDLRAKFLHGVFTSALEDRQFQCIKVAPLQHAQKLFRENIDKDYGPIIGVGVDVARGGKDTTCIAIRRGPRITCHYYQGKETDNGDKVAALVVRLVGSDYGGPITVDNIGVGSSAYDVLRKWFPQIRKCDARGKAYSRNRSGMPYQNVRGEMYWGFRESLTPPPEGHKDWDSWVDWEIDDNSRVLPDLCATDYKMMANGIGMEPKEKVSERLGRSPDSEAIIMLIWNSKKPLPGSWTPEPVEVRTAW